MVPFSFTSLLGEMIKMDNIKMSPQVKTLLAHLQQHGSISQAEAGLVYKIRALPRRIVDLKIVLKTTPSLSHLSITRELKIDPTGQRYARYSLVAEAPTVTTYEPVEAPIKALNVHPTLGDRVVVVSPSLTGGKYYAGCEGTVVKVRADKGSQGDDLWVNFDNGNLHVYVWGSELEVIAND